MLLIPNRLSLRLIASRVRRRGLSHTGTSRASAGALRLDGALILLILLILLLLLLLLLVLLRWLLLLLLLLLGVLRHRLGHHVGAASIRGLVHLLALGRGGRRRHGRVLGVCVLRLRDRSVRLGGLWLLGGDGPAHRDGRRVRVVALGPGAAVQAGGAVPVHHDGVVGQGDDEEDGFNATETSSGTQARHDSQVCTSEGICVARVVTTDGISVYHPRGDLRRQQGHGCNPEHNGEHVQSQYRPVVVPMDRAVLHNDVVDCDDHSRNSGEQGQAIPREGEECEGVGTEGQDDQGQDELDDADGDEAPGVVGDMFAAHLPVARVFATLHVGDSRTVCLYWVEGVNGRQIQARRRTTSDSSKALEE